MDPLEKTPSTRPLAHISLPIGTNGKPLAAIGKFPSAIGKLMVGKTLATNGEEVTCAMIGNDELKLQLQIILLIIIGNLEQIRNDW